jgi:amino acid transporter
VVSEHSSIPKSLLTEKGWFAVIGWQAAMASISFACAQQFEGLIALNVPNYVVQGWHGTLLSIGVTIFAMVWNTVLVRKLPLVEGIIVILHIFGFFAFVVVLWVMAPRSDPKEVWTDFQDNGGWGSIGLSCLVGMTGPVITLIGADSACHLSEELKDASYVLPRSMVATATVNYILGFVMTITVMSTLGDVTSVLTTTTGQPYIQVVLNATQSRVGTSILTALVAILLLFSAVNLVTTSSRQLFAFARDKGLPFSSTLAYVSSLNSHSENVLTVLGTSKLGYSSKRCAGNFDVQHTPQSYHHRLHHRVQYHHLNRSSWDRRLVHCCHRLHCEEANNERTPSTI